MAAPRQASVALDTAVRIETPEHVYFNYYVAGPASRALAYLIDLAVRIGGGLVLFIMLLMSGLAGGGDDALSGIGTGIMLVIFFVVEWFYYVLFELFWDGQSLGKRALRLRVVKQDGRRIGFGDTLLRNLLRAADALPSFYALGLTVMARDSAFRRLGDLAAGTLVVREQPMTERTKVALAPGIEEERARLPAYPAVSAAELDAIELFLRRRTSLPEAREHELAEMLAPALATRLGVRYRSAPAFLSALYQRSMELSS